MQKRRLQRVHKTEHLGKWGRKNIRTLPDHMWSRVLMDAEVPLNILSRVEPGLPREVEEKRREM